MTRKACAARVVLADALKEDWDDNLTYDNLEVGKFYLVAMDHKSESCSTAIVRLLTKQPPEKYPTRWSALSPKNKKKYVDKHCTITCDWLRRVWDTSICCTHLRSPKRDEVVAGDTREFVREMPAGVRLPPNLLWLCVDDAEKQRHSRLNANMIIRRVDVRWLHPLARVPKEEEDVFYCKKSFTERFKAFRYIQPEQLTAGQPAAVPAPPAEPATPPIAPPPLAGPSMPSNPDVAGGASAQGLHPSPRPPGHGPSAERGVPGNGQTVPPALPPAAIAAAAAPCPHHPQRPSGSAAPNPLGRGLAHLRCSAAAGGASGGVAAPAPGPQDADAHAGGAALASLPAELRYPGEPLQEEFPVKGEARVVPFLSARGAVPPAFAGRRADNPALRYGGAGGRCARVLHACCGPGGFALHDTFGEGLRGLASAGGLELVDAWGVDLKLDACTTFQANHRGAVVYHNRLDESVELVRRYNLLCDILQLPPRASSPACRRAVATGGEGSGSGGGHPQSPNTHAIGAGFVAGGSGGSAVPSMARPVDDANEAGARGSGGGGGGGEAGGGGGGCLGDMLALSLVHSAKVQDNGQLEELLGPGNCWLQVMVSRREGADEAAWDRLSRDWRRPDDVPGYLWVPVECLLAGPHAHPSHRLLLHDLLARVQDEQLIPRRGDVFAFASGPPCQHFTNHNAHAPNQDVMLDCKNRLVLPLLVLVKLLQPRYLIIEQVLGAAWRESGVWMRTIQGKLEMWGYEHLIADVAAGAHGAAEDRQRLFVAATAYGWPLLRPPCPTHSHKPRNTYLTITRCRPVPPPGTRLRRQNTCRDAISDMERASNWRMSALGTCGGGNGTCAGDRRGGRGASRGGGGGSELCGGDPAASGTISMRRLLSTAQPPPGTTSRAARTAISFGLSAASDARLCLRALDVYRLELGKQRRILRAPLAGEARATRAAVLAMAMAGTAAAAAEPEGGARGGCPARSEAVEAEAHKRALEALGGALLGAQGSLPSAAQGWISAQPTGRLERQAEWNRHIQSVKRLLGDELMGEIEQARRRFRQVADGFIAALEEELRLARGSPAGTRCRASSASQASAAAPALASPPPPPPPLQQQPRQQANEEQRPLRAGAGVGQASGARGGGDGRGCCVSESSGAGAAGGGRAVGTDGYDPWVGDEPPFVANHAPLQQTVASMERIQLIPVAESCSTRLWDVAGTLPEGSLLVCGEAPMPCRQIDDERESYTRLGWDDWPGVIECCHDVSRRRIVHPEQDRIFTPRELMRMHGFPDYYVMCVAPEDLGAAVHEGAHGMVSYGDVVATALRCLRVAQRLWGMLEVAAEESAVGAAAPAAAAAAAAAAASLQSESRPGAAGGAGGAGQQRDGMDDGDGDDGDSGGVGEVGEGLLEGYYAPPRNAGDAATSFAAAARAVHRERAAEFGLVGESVSPLVAAAWAGALRRAAAGPPPPAEGGGMPGPGPAECFGAWNSETDEEGELDGEDGSSSSSGGSDTGGGDGSGSGGRGAGECSGEEAVEVAEEEEVRPRRGTHAVTRKRRRPSARLTRTKAARSGRRKTPKPEVIDLVSSSGESEGER